MRVVNELRHFKRIVLLLLLSFTLVSSYAQNYTYVFTASTNLTRPITIKTSDGTFKLYGEDVVIHDNITWWSAEDANGVHIMQPGASREIHFSSNSPSSCRIHYHLTTLDPVSASSASKKRTIVTSSNPFSGSRRARALARQEAKENEEFEKSFITSFKGSYYSPGKYNNIDEFIVWRLPSPPSPRQITSPSQYCGHWSYIEGDDTWNMDIDLVDSEFVFSVKRRDVTLDLYRQENENNWLFFSETYTNLDDEIARRGIKYYQDACDTDADPGFPTDSNRRYKYNEYFSIWYYRVSLVNGQVKVAPVLAHRDYYYYGDNVYSETYEGNSYDARTLRKK